MRIEMLRTDSAGGAANPLGEIPVSVGRENFSGEPIHRHRNALPATPASGQADGKTVDQRWVSIGATDLQTGLMALTRGVAQPTTF